MFWSRRVAPRWQVAAGCQHRRVPGAGPSGGQFGRALEQRERPREMVEAERKAEDWCEEREGARLSCWRSALQEAKKSFSGNALALLVGAVPLRSLLPTLLVLWSP